MNAVWLITVRIVRGAPIERLSAERPRPDPDSGRGRVHHELVCAYDVCSLYSMRHSECATSRRVPILSGKTLVSRRGAKTPGRVEKQAGSAFFASLRLCGKHSKHHDNTDTPPNGARTQKTLTIAKHPATTILLLTHDVWPTLHCQSIIAVSDTAGRVANCLSSSHQKPAPSPRKPHKRREKPWC